ncbi:MAG TPA: hypothetical protein VHV75_00595 [Solirubrobacteraceae bacterium]|nr:hypothetical protein [Solirubrobacteraceae bacterium]
MRRTAAALASAALVALSPAVAGAKTYAPPGKAGSSEYAETLPASGGNIAPPTSADSASGATLSKLGAGRKGAQQLAKLGKAGQSAAAFARATAPPLVPAAGPTSASAASGPAGGSALSGLVHLIGGSDVDGIGVFLPLLLAFGLGAAVAVSVLRVRRGGQQPS